MPEQMKTYLEQLKFPESLRRSWMSSYLSNPRLMALFVAAITLFGITSFLTMPRSLNPEVKIPIVITSVVLPGASPQDVESLVTIPLENEIKNVDGVTTYSSSSLENVSTVVAEFRANIDPKQARTDVKAAVDQAQLPDDAQNPMVTDIDFEDIYIWSFALIKKQNGDTSSLYQLADRIKTKMESLPVVDRVIMKGFEQEEIQVVIDAEQLKEKNIEVMALTQAISQSLASFPAGSVVVNGNTFSVSLAPTVGSIEELRQLKVNVHGQVVSLGEVARVQERSQPDQYPLLLADQERESVPAVQFLVYKTASASIAEMAATTRQSVEELIAPYSAEYEILTVEDYDEQITLQFGELTENFFQTLLLVFLSMFAVYGLRQALVASLAIPFPLLITFVVMQGMGISLSFISIFSLLIALGLFVDNAVVVIEAFSSYYKTGKFTALEAGLLVWRDFFVPLFSINLVTVWAFLPLLLTEGIIGEFIKPIPIIVSTSMFASVLIALLFTLPSLLLLTRKRLPKRVTTLFSALLVIAVVIGLITIIPQSALFLPTLLALIMTLLAIWFLRSELKVRLGEISRLPRIRRNLSLVQRVMDQGFITLEPVVKKYRSIIVRLVRSKKYRWQTMVIIASVTLLSYALVPLGLVKNEFFPKTDVELLYIQVELPRGTEVRSTYAEMQRLINEVRTTPEVKQVVAEVGAGASDGFGGGQNGQHTMNMILLLGKADDRKAKSWEIAEQLRDQYKEYAVGKFQVIEASGGPPAGADIQIEIRGDELPQISEYVTQVEEFLKNKAGVTNVARSVEVGTSRIVFTPDEVELREHGVSEAQLGGFLRTQVAGMTLAKSRFAQTERDIVFRTSMRKLSSEELNGLEVPTPNGFIPLTELGDFSLQENPSVVSRQEGQRAITVTASALPGYSVSTLNTDLETFVTNDIQFASGYSWKTGGVNEENAKSVQSILRAMGLSAILILVSMVVQLRSFRKAFIVMLAIPLALSGVFIWFGLFGTPLSFPALVGMLALFGIVIANSIVLVDKINQNLDAGLDQEEAIVDAAASRLEPIALTSISSIIGLIPITLSDPLWEGLGGAIIAGLSFSGTLMLFFIPVVYTYLYPVKPTQRNGK